MNDKYSIILEGRLVRLETLIETQQETNKHIFNRMDRMESKIDRHFYWTITLIIGSMLMPFIHSIFKAKGWL